MTTTETFTINGTRSEYAGNLRNQAAREHAERIGGIVCGTSRKVCEVHTSHDAWMAGEAPVAAYRIGQ